jgi:DNA polymerase-3 subunit epsilon
MIIMPFDPETSGIPNWKIPSESSSQPHIVSLAAALVDSVTGEVMEKMDVIVMPTDWTIDKETIDVHGITMERAMDEGIPEEHALDMFMQMWRKCQKRIAFNATFDNRIIRIAQKRFFSDSAEHVEWMRSWQEDKAQYYCVMQAAKKAMGASKLPTLGEAYSHFMHKPLENAHQAMADTLACLEIYFAINGMGILNEPAATCATPAATSASDALIAELEEHGHKTANDRIEDEVGFL